MMPLIGIFTPVIMIIIMFFNSTHGFRPSSFNKWGPCVFSGSTLIPRSVSSSSPQSDQNYSSTALRAASQSLEKFDDNEEQQQTASPEMVTENTTTSTATKILMDDSEIFRLLSGLQVQVNNISASHTLFQAQQEHLQARQASFQTQQEDLQARQSTLQTRQESFQQQLEGLGAQNVIFQWQQLCLQAQQSRLQTEQAVSGATISKILTSVEGLDKRLDYADNRFESFEKRFDRAAAGGILMMVLVGTLTSGMSSSGSPPAMFVSYLISKVSVRVALPLLACSAVLLIPRNALSICATGGKNVLGRLDKLSDSSLVASFFRNNLMKLLSRKKAKAIVLHAE